MTDRLKGVHIVEVNFGRVELTSHRCKSFDAERKEQNKSLTRKKKAERPAEGEKKRQDGTCFEKTAK